MKNILWYLLLPVLMMPSHGICAESNLKIGLRVRPLGMRFTLICRATNVSAEDVAVDRFLLHGANQFEISVLHDPDRGWYGFGAPEGMPPDVEIIPPSRIRQWELGDLGFKDLEYRSTYDESLCGPGIGRYQRIRWFINGMRSLQEVLIGIAGEDGTIRMPVARSGRKSPEVFVGVVYDRTQQLKVGFLFVNGEGNKTIEMEGPLTHKSKVVVTSPAISYTRELFIPAAVAERVVVEAGKVGEWRLPWKTVLDLIPKEDLERIRASGGDLDLVWKVGEYSSDPLPLNLAAPPPEPAP